MTTHSNHPPIPEAGLADGCGRCEKHSMYPFVSLDDRNLILLVERIRSNLSPRSTMESAAMHEVQKVFDAIKRLERLDLIHDCSDDTCPCWEAGFLAAQETVGEWYRPLGY